jgi:prolipoprotein diacylglyceryl transferase
VLAEFTMKLDPVLLRLGPLEFRYYGLIFVLTLGCAYWVWRWQMRRGGYSDELASRFLVMGAVATIVGARLGHILFYEPAMFVEDPLGVLAFWRGGLASHGAAIGIIIALWLFARRSKMRLLEVMDRFAMSTAVGASGIRLANFLNSEVVGRAADVPWAVRFVHYEDHGMIARHPSQLYELAMGLCVLLLLYLVDRWAGREKRPLGLLSGVFMTSYFAGRFVVEFFKEHQVPAVESHTVLTMGQMLSILPLAIGVAILVRSIIRREPTPRAPAAAGSGAATAAKSPATKRRR